jgi:hypothetical protein
MYLDASYEKLKESRVGEAKPKESRVGVERKWLTGRVDLNRREEVPETKEGESDCEGRGC